MQRTLFVPLFSVVLLISGCTRLTPEQKATQFMEKGKALLAKREYSRALLEFRNAGTIRKSDAELYYQSGLAFMGIGDVKGAIGQLRGAIKLNPNHAEAQLLYAKLLAESGVPALEKVAAEHLDIVLKQIPQNQEALSTLAVAEIQMGKQEGAVDHLKQALVNVPDDYKAAAVLASLKLAQKDEAGAEEILKGAAAHAPRSPELAVVLGRFYMLGNKMAPARDEFRRALAIEPKFAPALMDLANVQMATGDMSGAGEVYKRLASFPDKQYKPLHAVFLMRQKQYTAAIAEFRQLYKSDTENREVRSGLTTALVYNNQRPEAARILADALQKNPKDTEALLQRSELYQMDGKLDKAEQDLNQVLNFKRDMPAAHIGLARVYKQQGQLARAREQLQEALRLDPTLMTVRAEISELLLAEKDSKAAMDVIDKAPAAQKKDPRLVAQRNWALLAAKDYAGARNNITAALQVQQTPDLLIQDAILKLNQQDFEGGRASLDQALQKDPGNVRAVELVYNSYRAQKRGAEGLVKIQQCADKAADSAVLQYFVAKQLVDNGQRKEARQRLEAAKHIDPTFTVADMTLAQMDLMENNLDSARGRISGVLASDPKNVAALFLLGNIEDAAGDPAAAAEQYRKIVSIDGTNIVALNNLAFHLAESPESKTEAVQYGEKALQLQPDNPELQDTAGWVYYKAGLYDQAVRLLETAAKNGDVSERKLHLALVYLKTGRAAQARQLIASIEQKDPAFLKSKPAIKLINDAGQK